MPFPAVQEPNSVQSSILRPARSAGHSSYGSQQNHSTAGSWESATSPFWGSTSSQHGWPPLGNSPLLEIRKFQSSNVGKHIVNRIYCDVSTDSLLPAQRE